MSEINWHALPGELPQKSGLYMVTRKDRKTGEVSVFFDAYATLSIFPKDPERLYFYSEKEWIILAWAELPEPYCPPCGQAKTRMRLEKNTLEWHAFPQEKPPMCGVYLVTRKEEEGGRVAIDFEIYSTACWPSLDGKPSAEPVFCSRKGYTLLAWAFFPKPYRPPEPEDSHPDAETARAYVAGDPETLRRLSIFD